MKPILVPTSDVNSEFGVVVDWFADNRSAVDGDAVLVEVETSKAVLEVVAPEPGVILYLADKGQEISLTDPVALLFPDKDALTAYEERQRQARENASTSDGGPRASVKALRRAEELGVDLSTFDTGRLITVKDVEEAAAAAQPFDVSSLPSPLTVAEGVQRVLLIGGGLGATQVIDIFAGSTTQAAVAILDDTRDKWGSTVVGVPVVGGTDRLAALFASGAFDAVVIAISTSVAVRAKFRAACASAGIPLANAIDKTAKIATDVELGQGNVICAFVHLGTGVRMGDNNFLSAYNSYDHHSKLGNDISTGPGCMTSGVVTLGDRVRLGTGIFIEPGLELGEGVQVASGAIIVKSVPAHHAVKAKSVNTVVVPLRR